MIELKDIGDSMLWSLAYDINKVYRFNRDLPPSIKLIQRAYKDIDEKIIIAMWYAISACRDIDFGDKE